MNTFKSFLISALFFQLGLMEEKPDCEQQKDIFAKKITNSAPEMKPLSRNTFGIIWKHLLDDNYLTCLDKIELKNGFGQIIMSEDKMDKIVEKKPFIQKLDICKEHKKRTEEFTVLFHLKKAKVDNIQRIPSIGHC